MREHVVAQQELRLMLIGIVAWRHSSVQELIIIIVLISSDLCWSELGTLTDYRTFEIRTFPGFRSIQYKTASTRAALPICGISV